VKFLFEIFAEFAYHHVGLFVEEQQQFGIFHII